MMQSLVKFRNKKKGFTLVELIVVIAIIGILAAILMPRFMGFTDDARKKAVISETKSIRTLAETYYANYGVWPDADKATSGFKVPSGKNADGTPDYTNSPAFTGTLDDEDLENGVFEYTKDNITAKSTDTGAIDLS